jgi:hypothetical protein
MDQAGGEGVFFAPELTLARSARQMQEWRGPVAAAAIESARTASGGSDSNATWVGRGASTPRMLCVYGPKAVVSKPIPTTKASVEPLPPKRLPENPALKCLNKIVRIGVPI